MAKLSDNPAKVMHELLSDPAFKKRICQHLGIPEDTEIDDESFKQAEDLCMRLVDYAEDKIDEHITFVDGEGFPVHIAEKDFKPPSSDS